MHLHAFGQDVAGLDAVHGDAIAGKLKRRRLDEAVDAGLGRRIVAMAGAGDARAGDRRGENHPALSLCLHDGQCGARRKIGAPEVDGHHLVPFLGLDVFDQRPGIDAGILHDDVEPAVGGDGFVHRPLGIGFLRNVGCDEAAA